jgi:hypothetical protein
LLYHLEGWSESEAAFVDETTGEFEEWTPPEIIEGHALVPACMPLWKAFGRLSRGRAYAVMNGQPLPLTYRDIRDECERCGWPDQPEAEDIIAAMDALFMRISSDKLAKMQD